MTEKKTLQTAHGNIPLYVVYERRKGYRAAFTKKGLVIRLPKQLNRFQQKQLEQNMQQWAVKQLKKNPAIINRYIPNRYDAESHITTFDNRFIINATYLQIHSAKGTLRGNTLYLQLPKKTTDIENGEMARKLISRLLAQHYKHPLEERLVYWNRFFSQQYSRFILRYATSRWGSCSQKKTISLSTRLLLTSAEVIDYVMVHELAHLRHLNHSPAFGHEVRRVMPDYKKYDTWLTLNGKNIDF